jgi:hypothetical protein
MEYTTRSLPLAAFLVAARKLKLSRVEATSHAAFFVFDDPNHNGADLEAEFLSGQAIVSASGFHAQLRRLKSRAVEKVAEAKQQGGER